jgi:thiamine-monophosphate kinase
MSLTEFDLIRRFTADAVAGRPGAGVILGIGDDAAVLRPPAGEDLAMTVDAVVEGVHFDRRFRPEDIGWKALAVNLSDVAAMGGRPLWALCALGLGRDPSPARLTAVGRGLAACGRAYGVALVGGNVTRSRDLSLTVTVVAAVPRGGALRRGGARPGDALLVSGALGGASLGLRPDAAPAWVRRQRRPIPRLALGRALLGRATAAIDVSDGLLQDLAHLCEASGVGATLHLAEIPAAAPRRKVGPGQALAAALNGGEDYELLVAIPRRRVAEARAAARKVGVPLTAIGALSAELGVRLVDRSGARVTIASAGHDHVRRSGRSRRRAWTSRP